MPAAQARPARQQRRPPGDDAIRVVARNGQQHAHVEAVGKDRQHAAIAKEQRLE